MQSLFILNDKEYSLRILLLLGLLLEYQLLYEMNSTVYRYDE